MFVEPHEAIFHLARPNIYIAFLILVFAKVY